MKNTLRHMLTGTVFVAALLMSGTPVASASVVTGTLTGGAGVGSTATGTLSGSAGSGGSISGTVSGGSSGGGGGSSGGSSGGGGGGQVLGASTGPLAQSTGDPGLPNTGEGGDAAVNYLLLGLSVLTITVGSVGLLRMKKTS